MLFARTAIAQSDTAPKGEEGGTGAVPSGSSGARKIATPETSADPKAVLNGVVMPKQTHFEPAPYPPLAARDKIEGDVVLQLDIGKDGSVSQVTVVSPLGHGLDQAASDAARKFRFDPGTRNGTPIAVRILYRYNFHLTPVEPAVDEPPKPVDNLRGTVLSTEGDLPLAGSEVTLHAPGGDRVLTTGEDGGFAFADLPPGKYPVSVKLPGFEPLQVAEEVVSGSATLVTYRLSVKGGRGDVTIRGARPPRESVRRTIEQREIARMPGTNGDALRSLQSLPGVARPPGLAGLLIVRGSSPQDSATFIDGVFIPQIYHFGGISSVVPTEILEKIDFYPGNFSAQYGRQMGAIVDVGIRSPKSDGKYHGLAQIDLIDARLLLEGPVPLLKDWRFVVGGRRSWVDTWLKPVLKAANAGVTSAPIYYDYQAFVETNPTPRSSLRVGLFGTDDRFEILIKNPSAQDPIVGGNLTFGTAFWRAMAIYRNDFSDDVRFSSVTSYGYDHTDFGLGTLFFKIGVKYLLNRTELSARLSPGVTLHSGLDFAYAPYQVDIRAPPPPRPGEPSPGPFISRPLRTLSTTDSAYRPGAYVEGEIAPDGRTKIIPGVRVDYARDTGHWDLSPRINARYNIHSEFPRTTVKGSVGIFHQPPQLQETASVFGTPNLHSNRAIHYSVGAEQELTSRLEVSLDTFYKVLDRLVARVPGAGQDFVYSNEGRGSVVGAELLLKYKPDARFFGWLSYTVSRSVRDTPPTYQEQLFQYDQTHMFVVLGSYELGRGWTFGSRFRVYSGNLYTPVTWGFVAADAGAYTQSTGLAFSRRLSLFHQLDLRVDKQWKYEKWTLSTYLDVQNAYNRQNPEGISYNYDFSQQSVQSGLPIIPSLGVRGEF